MTASSFRPAALLLVFGLGLAGCGVNGAPQPTTPDQFPHQYPPPEKPTAGAAVTTTPAPTPAPSPAYPPNTTNTNQPMYQ